MDTIFVGHRTGESLMAACGRAKRKLVLVSPFVKEATLRVLLNCTPPEIACTVITRWRAEEVAKGVSDTSILSLAGERRDFTVLLANNLHAKVYIVDDIVAYVSSANVTDRAMGFTVGANIEAGVILERAPLSLLVFVRRLELLATIATEEIRTAIEIAAEELKARVAAWNTLEDHSGGALALDDSSDFVNDNSSALNTNWLPRLRFPENLYGIYSESITDGVALEAGITDLAVLNPPNGLPQEEFVSFVRAKLMDHPFVVELRANLGTHGQRFGEITSWLRTTPPCAGLTHVQVQRIQQTLTRWLLWFCPDQFRLSTPNYTEILCTV